MILNKSPMKKIFIPSILLIIFASALNGQTARQYVKAADEEFAAEDYYSAMKHYQEAITINGEKPGVLFKYAEAARLFASYTFAGTAYTKVLASKKALDFPMAKFWLAVVKKKQGKYEESQALFNDFVKSKPETVDAAYFRQAGEEIKALDWAIGEIKRTDENVAVEPLDSAINSPYSEFAPAIQGDEIYFSSQNFERELTKGMPPRHISQILKRKAKGYPVEPLPINEELRHTANLAFNGNRTRVYYTLCDYVGETAALRCEIYFRNVAANGMFGEAQRLPDDINTPGYTATQPNIGTDPEMKVDKLYFASDKPGGKGGLNIWSCTVFKDGTFDKSFNLEQANSAGNDITPFFHNPSHTLFFSSDGRQGFGGFDFYKIAHRNDAWQEVEHIPAPYNSSYDDTNFWINEEQTKGYFASSRLGSQVLEPEFEACCNDLYSFTVQVAGLDVFTFNKRDETPLPGATLELFEITPNGELPLKSTTNPGSNDFNFELKKGSRYVVLATKENFLPLRDTIDLTVPANNGQRSIERNLYLVPATVDLKVFTYNKRTMNPLKAVEVRLAVDGQEVDFQQNKEGNEVAFVLDRGQLYELIGSKVAYFSDTAYIDLRTDVSSTNINEDLLLRPKEMEDYPPLVIYFDNDYPNPKSRKTTTGKSYEETWQAYMAQKDRFQREYVKTLVGQDSFVAARRIDAFFGREVNNGYESLKVFSESVLGALEDGGFKVELVIQGFASPRASEDYNFNLSQRRSNCLKNHFETWRGGILKPYINRGLLVMKVVGYGEKLASQYISDRLDDERGSIYSITASSERKVAIIGARRVVDN
jgi:tetratricopeptide (TPR) repeat protein